MNSFPQELFHCVVDFFRDDPPSLATVRLVSRAWNVSATPHLFRSLDLLISEPPPSSCHASPRSFHKSTLKYTGLHKFQVLGALLESTNDISRCVRQVSLGRTTTFGSSDPEVQARQNAYALLISSILSRFTYLSGIIFREMNWTNLNPSFLSCVLASCKIPSLERIEIWNCQMPTTTSLLDFLSASRNVKSLRFSYFRILAVDDARLPPSAPVSQGSSTQRPSGPEPCMSLLQNLAIDAAPDAFVLHNIFRMPPYSINFPKLRRLYLANVTDSTDLAEFLHEAGHSLEFLDLRLIARMFSSRSPISTLYSCVFFLDNLVQSRLSPIHFDLSHCPRLQHLRISGLQWTPTLCPSEYLSSLFTKTSDLPLPIERLQLMITVIKPKSVISTGLACVESQGDSDILSPPPPMPSRPTGLQYSDWTILDHILSSHTFRALKSFQISLNTIRDREVDPSRLTAMFPKVKDKAVQVTCTYY